MTENAVKPQAKSTALKAKTRDNKGVYKRAGGSMVDAFNLAIYRQVQNAAWEPAGVEDKTLIFVGTALAAFNPKDEIEGMMAAQAVALHQGAMECLRRAMIPDQPFDFAARHRKDAANLIRTFGEVVESLERKRGKGPQVVRVERVVVQEGGQAIVGNVAPRGAG